MNINLGGNYPASEGHVESFQSEIEEHQEILRNAGVAVYGKPVLVPEPGAEYPGSYQVWSPCLMPTSPFMPGWVYIDPDGVAIYTDGLPSAQSMEE